MITITKAQVEDAPELLKIKINAFQQEVELYGSGPPGYDDLESEMNVIKAGDYFKITKEGIIIGGIIIANQGDGHYHLGGIFVDLKYQNLGIGTMAMKFLDTEFSDAKKWSLETPHLSIRNHHFYEKMGFVKIGETTPDPENNGFHLFQYEKLKR